jgi:hypothetical protein
MSQSERALYMNYFINIKNITRKIYALNEDKKNKYSIKINVGKQELLYIPGRISLWN